MAKREPWNPLLKSYPDSRKVNAVSIPAEMLYVRLIAASDDHAHYWANPRTVLAKLLTHRWEKGEAAEKKVAGWLAELEGVGLISRYESGGDVYLEVTDCKKALRKDVKHDIRFPDNDYPNALRMRNECVTNPGRLPNPTQPNPTEEKPSPPYQKILEAWEEICGVVEGIGTARPLSMTDSRREHLRARWAEPAFRDGGGRAAMEKIAASSFCRGKNDRGWTATFDWFIANDTNYVKALEGTYDNRAGGQSERTLGTHEMGERNG